MCHSAFYLRTWVCFVPTTFTRLRQTSVRAQHASEPVSILSSNLFHCLSVLSFRRWFLPPAYKHAMVHSPSPQNFCALSSSTVLWQAPLGSSCPLCPARRTHLASALDSLPFRPPGDLTGLQPVGSCCLAYCIAPCCLVRELFSTLPSS